MPEFADDTEIALLKREINDLKEKVDELSVLVRTLADSWNRASGALALVKWVLGILACAGGLAALVKYRLIGPPT